MGAKYELLSSGEEDSQKAQRRRRKSSESSLLDSCLDNKLVREAFACRRKVQPLFYLLCGVSVLMLIYQVMTITQNDSSLMTVIKTKVRHRINEKLHNLPNSKDTRESKVLAKNYAKHYEDKHLHNTNHLRFHGSTFKECASRTEVGSDGNYTTYVYSFVPANDDVLPYDTGSDLVMARLVSTEGTVFLADKEAKDKDRPHEYTFIFNTADRSKQYFSNFVRRQKYSSDFVEIIRIQSGRDVEIVERMYKLHTPMGVNSFKVEDKRDAKHVQKCYPNYSRHHMRASKGTTSWPSKAKEQFICENMTHPVPEANAKISPELTNYGFVIFLENQSVDLPIAKKSFNLKTQISAPLSPAIQPEVLNAHIERLIDTHHSLNFIGDASIQAWYDHIRSQVMSSANCVPGFHSRYLEPGTYAEEVELPQTCTSRVAVSREHFTTRRIARIMHGGAVLSSVDAAAAPHELDSLQEVMKARDADQPTLVFVGIGLEWTLFNQTYFQNRLKKIRGWLETEPRTGLTVIIKTIEMVNMRPHLTIQSSTPPCVIHKFNGIIKDTFKNTNGVKIADTYSMTLACNDELSDTTPYVKGNEFLAKVMDRTLYDIGLLDM